LLKGLTLRGSAPALQDLLLLSLTLFRLGPLFISAKSPHPRRLPEYITKLWEVTYQCFRLRWVSSSVVSVLSHSSLRGMGLGQLPCGYGLCLALLQGVSSKFPCPRAYLSDPGGGTSSTAAGVETFLVIWGFFFLAFFGEASPFVFRRSGHHLPFPVSRVVDLVMLDRSGNRRKAVKPSKPPLTSQDFEFASMLALRFLPTSYFTLVCSPRS
jgi:hypothetical protein